MSNDDFEWLNDNWAPNYGTPDFSIYDSPGGGTPAGHASQVGQRACQATEHVDQPSGEDTLPLLRLSGWESGKRYDKNDPVCIHYDFWWKIS